jgi:hypothetical protein
VPKSKRKGGNSAEVRRSESSTMPVKPWVRWIALALILILATSVLAGAITAAPAQAAETSPTPSAAEIMPAAETTCLLDNDGDGVPNPDDQDIDGDEVVNGEDNDIDGDGIGNFDDGDPAATNCNDDAAPPLMATTGLSPAGQDDGFLVTLGIVFALALVVVITLLARRQKKEKQ